MKTFKLPKYTRHLLAVGVVASLALGPAVASAHTDLFLGFNLGGLFAPPVVTYAPPRYYPPAPTYYYAPAPTYYRPRVVVRTPGFAYYRGSRRPDRAWYRGRRAGHRGHHWNRGAHRDHWHH